MAATLIIPEDRVIQIESEYKAGRPVIHIAKQFGYGATTITRLLTKRGVYTLQPRQFYLLADKQDVISQLYSDGMSISILAKQYGVTHMVMRHFFKNNNIPTRPTTSNLNNRENEIAQEYQNGATLKEIGVKFNICSEKTVKRVLIEAGINLRTADESIRLALKNQTERSKVYSVSRYDIDATFLDSIDSEEKAYFLGFFYADGYNNQKKGHVMIELNEKDQDILERFMSFFGSTKELIQEKPSCKKFILHSKYLSNRLAELGAPQRKSFILTFPDWMPTNLLHHFMRGYNDGDGCIYRNGKQATVMVVGSDSFIGRFAEIIKHKCSVNASTKKHHISKGISTINIYGVQQVKRVLDFLYRDATISLNRKRLKADEIISLPVR